MIRLYFLRVNSMLFNENYKKEDDIMSIKELAEKLAEVCKHEGVNYCIVLEDYRGTNPAYNQRLYGCAPKLADGSESSVAKLVDCFVE